MRSDTPIPRAAFAAAVERLDAETLAAFVGALRAETADEVTVDPPRVTVRTDGSRTDLLVVVGGDVPEIPTDVDGVVTAGPAVTDSGRRVVTPADLRRRLLYGLSPDAADTLCERFLGVPARGEYATAGSNPDVAGEDGTAAGGGDDTPAGTRDDAPSEGRDGVRSRSGDGARSSAGTRTGKRRDDDSPGDSRSDGTADRVATTPALAGRRRVAVVVVVLLVVVAIGVGAGSGLPSVGDQSGSADGQTPIGVETATTSAGGGSSGPANGTEGTSTATPRSVGDAGERPLGGNRNVGLEPTCTRSPLLVVQIQLNALKYNDDATDDGIRTVRRFASPRNRQAVGSFETFVTVVRSERYAPMLSWESAEFTPRRIDARTATVRVVTAVEGNVTGRFGFRLGKQEGGVYDGCWMTESVRSLAFNRTG